MTNTTKAKKVVKKAVKRVKPPEDMMTGLCVFSSVDFGRSTAFTEQVLHVPSKKIPHPEDMSPIAEFPLAVFPVRMVLLLESDELPATAVEIVGDPNSESAFYVDLEGKMRSLFEVYGDDMPVLDTYGWFGANAAVVRQQLRVNAVHGSSWCRKFLFRLCYGAKTFVQDNAVSGSGMQAVNTTAVIDNLLAPIRKRPELRPTVPTEGLSDWAKKEVQSQLELRQVFKQLAAYPHI